MRVHKVSEKKKTLFLKLNSSGRPTSPFINRLERKVKIQTSFSPQKKKFSGVVGVVVTSLRKSGRSNLKDVVVNFSDDDGTNSFSDR